MYNRLIINAQCYLLSTFILDARKQNNKQAIFQYLMQCLLFYGVFDDGNFSTDNIKATLGRITLKEVFHAIK